MYHQWRRNSSHFWSTRVHSQFSWGSCCSIFVFLCSVQKIIVYLIVIFYFWPLYLLSLYLRLLITLLVTTILYVLPTNNLGIASIYKSSSIKIEYIIMNTPHKTRSLVLCVLFCRSLFVLLYFFFWILCCLFFDLRILGTPLLFSNFS